jgi:hypothetical protein
MILCSYHRSDSQTCYSRIQRTPPCQRRLCRWQGALRADKLGALHNSDRRVPSRASSSAIYAGIVGNGDHMHRPCVECGNVLFKAAFSQKQWQRHGKLASRCKQCVAGSPHSARPKTCTEASGCNCSLDPCILVRQQMHTAGRLLPLDSLNVEGGERMPFAIVLPVKEVRYTSTCAPYV